MANSDPAVNGSSDPTPTDPILSGKYWWIDLIREITRNVVGAGAIGFILYMLRDFVIISPEDDRMQVMLLIIGYLGGFMTGIATWYFGGAMRSASKAAIAQAKEGK